MPLKRLNVVGKKVNVSAKRNFFEGRFLRTTCSMLLMLHVKIGVCVYQIAGVMAEASATFYKIIALWYLALSPSHPGATAGVKPSQPRYGMYLSIGQLIESWRNKGRARRALQPGGRTISPANLSAYVQRWADKQASRQRNRRVGISSIMASAIVCAPSA